jgi:hypothetical protein
VARSASDRCRATSRAASRPEEAPHSAVALRLSRYRTTELCVKRGRRVAHNVSLVCTTIISLDIDTMTALATIAHPSAVPSAVLAATLGAESVTDGRCDKLPARQAACPTSSPRALSPEIRCHVAQLLCRHEAGCDHQPAQRRHPAQQRQLTAAGQRFGSYALQQKHHHYHYRALCCAC